MPEQRQYTGASGQMLVMAELLVRKCNAAVPVMDFGMDVFAFLDDREDLARIQVKTARAGPYKKKEGYSAVFHIPKRQLNRDDNPPLFYALVARAKDAWGDCIIIGRPDLRNFWNGPIRFGSEDKQDLKITIQFRPDRVVCSGVDMSQFRNAWETLPPLKSVVPLNGG